MREIFELQEDVPLEYKEVRAILFFVLPLVFSDLDLLFWFVGGSKKAPPLRDRTESPAKKSLFIPIIAYLL